jgi:hypothetical protein
MFIARGAHSRKTTTRERSMLKSIGYGVTALAFSASVAFAASSTQPAVVSPHKTHMHSAMHSNASANRETKALNLLGAKGYASFTNFQGKGKDYSALVQNNGHDMTVIVDPDNGSVTESLTQS